MYVGCAGGLDANIEISYGKEPVEAGRVCYCLEIKNFKGGHSGMDIILQRGNANKSLFRILKALQEVDVRLCEVEGGNMRNAIPRDAKAIIALPTDKITRAKEIVDSITKDIKAELAAVETEFSIHFEPTATVKEMMKECCSKRIINAVYAMPNAIYRMSDSVKGLVETSSNLAIVKSDGEKVIMCCLLRSSVDSEKHDLAMMMKSVIDLAEGKIEFSGEYPGWKPNLQSPILNEMIQSYKKLFGVEPKVMAIHAGLECGVMGGTYPNWDMISLVQQ